MKAISENSQTIVTILFVLFVSTLLIPAGAAALEPDDKEVQETITMWLMYKMRKDLDIPEKTCITLVEKIEQCESMRRNFFRYEHETMLTLEAMLPNEGVDMAAYKKLIDELDNKKMKVLTAEMNLQKELNSQLNPKQRAQLIVIMNDLRERIHRILRSLEKKRRDPRPRRRQ